MTKHTLNSALIFFYVLGLVTIPFRVYPVSLKFKDTTSVSRQYKHYKAEVNFEFLHDKLIAKYSVDKQILYNKPSAYNGQSFTFSDHFTRVTSRHAYLMQPKKNGKYKTKEIKFHSRNTRRQSHVFYQDLIEEEWFYPNIDKGYISGLSIASEISDPVLTPVFYFNLELRANEIVYKITVPDFLKVKLIIYGDSSGITHTSVYKNFATIHTFSCTNRDAIIYEDNSNDMRYYTPHLFIIPESYTQNSETHTLAGSLPNLFKMYNENLHDIPASDDTQLKHLTDSLVNGINDTLQKIEKIYDWIQKNIKYVAFEEGRGGFIPRPTDKILQNRYGDCKDKSNLLIKMLTSANINAYYTWIGTRSKPYRYTDIASPHVDDHMIVTTRFRGQWIFLDATTANLDVYYPSAFIQGEQAFIRLNDSSFTVQDVPIMPPESSVKVDSIKLSLSGDRLIGQGVQTITGYIKERYQDILHYDLSTDVSSLRNELNIGNNKLIINKLELGQANPNELKPHYDFMLPNYIQEFNGSVFLNMNLIKDFENDFIKVSERKLDIKRDYEYQLSQYIEINIPENMAFSQIPSGSSYNGDGFSFNLNYTQSNDHKLILDKKISVSHLTIKTNEFESWNNMIEQLNKAYSEVIIIKNKK